jgi:hypothetical protein
MLARRHRSTSSGAFRRYRQGVAIRARVPIVLLSAVVLAGCGTPTTPEVRIVDGRATPCVDEPAASAEEFLQCPQAIRLAVLRLGLTPGEASALEFYREEDCLSLGMTVPIDCGFVVAWFSSASPLQVPIRPHRTGGFVAQSPTAPPQELIDRGPVATAPPP